MMFSVLLRPALRARPIGSLSWLLRVCPQRSFSSAANLLRENRSTPTTGNKLSEGKPELSKFARSLPNALTFSRILACPLLGYLIVQGASVPALTVFVYSCATDFFDGYLARKWQAQSPMGSIIDPAADKLLMFTLTTTLAHSGAIPLTVAAVIIGRDALLAMSAFVIRYRSLPAPKTWKRYWDLTVPSVEVHPSTISKYNTAFQMGYLGLAFLASSTVGAVPDAITYFGWMTACTTLWSGLDYLWNKKTLRYIK